MGNADGHRGRQVSNRKPTLSFWQIWNMCFGFLGIQFGFALQNANVSRIFQTLGADVGDIPMLWVAAPLSGLIVQPIIGHYSDRTWTRLGRRRPYFLAGAVLTTLALLFMPNAPTLWVAAGLLWIMDASINVSMEPFRAFVGDQLPTQQRASGYAMQSFFIGIGAVVASALPWILAKLGVSNAAGASDIPDTVKYAFYAGAVVLFGSVLWTIVSTREYPPDALKAFDIERPVEDMQVDRHVARRWGLAWLFAGTVATVLVAVLHAEHELYLLTAGITIYGIALLWLAATASRGTAAQVLTDLLRYPTRCAASPGCSSFRGLRCLPCGYTPRPASRRCILAAATRTRRRITKAPTGWVCCLPLITVSQPWRRSLFPGWSSAGVCASVT
jgi:maltose/moltooligosaccharide transporter